MTFDDGRADSWTGADAILRKLRFNAVMFVDTGRVDRCDPEYLTWPELRTVQDSGRWLLQLHAGAHGHEYIQYGRDEDQTGPFYAYKELHEKFAHWQKRVRSDIDGGKQTLADHFDGFMPLAFALPYGAYGQQGTNGDRIPADLLGWLTQEFGAVVTQDRNALAHAGVTQPLGRIQVTRATTGGALHSQLLGGNT